MAWSKICKSKQEGGLGIPMLRELNIAIVSKLAWKVAEQVRGSLAANILAPKYGGWKAMIQGQRKEACSHTCVTLARYINGSCRV